MVEKMINGTKNEESLIGLGTFYLFVWWAKQLALSRPSMHRIIKYSSDLRGFLIFAGVLDPSGTKLSISLENPSADVSAWSDAAPVDVIEPVSTLSPWLSTEESVFPILLGTGPSKEEDGAVASK